MQSTLGKRFLQKFTELIRTYRKWVSTHNGPNKTTGLGEDMQEIDGLKQITPEPQKEPIPHLQGRRNIGK